MKKILFIVITTLLLIGCSTEGNIKIINRTEHALYFTIKGNDYVLKGSEDPDNSPAKKSVSINTGKRFLFWGGDDKKVDLSLEGETFMMQEGDLSGNPTGDYFTETTLTVHPDETTKVHAFPTHAGVKVVNISDRFINDLSVSKNQGNFIPIIYDIAPGDSAWSRLSPSTFDNPITYEFRIVLDNYELYYYGPVELFVDEQYVILAYY